MPNERVFIAYDFEIKGGLISDFEYVNRKQPKLIEWPGRPEGRSQGEIWRNIVRPKLDSFPRFVAFVDLPNANVGFEIGYALGHGEGKEAALAHTRDELPRWLKLPPLDGFYCQQIVTGEDLLGLVVSEQWFKSPPCPERGNKILILCPPKAGHNFLDLVKENHPAWLTLPADGWSFNDLPEKLNDVGVVVWLIVPHREGGDARDGSENAAAAVVAGYAEAAGLQLKVLKHIEARAVVDVAPKALEFGNEKQLLEQLAQIEQEIEAKSKKSIAPADQQEQPAFSRPDVGHMPELDSSIYTNRFIGREGFLEDLADALRGLSVRSQGQTTTGGAKVQAFWYHGFGGMGKSWFLRKAMLQAAQALPSAKVALVDWDDVVWSAPLLQPPESAKDILDAIAFRLAQLYGPEAFDRYWHALHRTEKVRGELSRHQERFNQQLRDLREDKPVDHPLRSALADKKLSANGNELAKSLDENSALRKELFDRWFEKGGGSSEDPEALLRPDALRTNALQNCIRGVVTAVAPLVLVLDTCEHLTHELERSLRQLIAPLCDGRLPLLVIFGSRRQPDFEEPDGSRDRWRALVGEERWRSVAFDEGVRFTVQEIQHALQKVNPPVDGVEKTAEALHRITRGVPLALQSLLDLHNQGSHVLSELDNLGSNHDEDELDEMSAVDEVVKIIAGRFLLHLKREERLADFKDIIALSLLTRSHREILSKLWNTRNVRGRLRDLAHRYALLSELDLHATVRSFLRLRWRMEDRPGTVEEVIGELDNLVDELDVPGQPGDAEYMEALATRLNVKAWKEEGKALERFAPAIAMALAFNQHVNPLVSLVAEIRVADSKRSRALKALKELKEDLAKGPYWIETWGSDDVLMWLEQEEARTKWSPAEKASLDLLKGFKRGSKGEYKEALQPLLAALAVFSEGNLPQQAQFGEVLFNVGYNLTEKKDSMADAIRAYEGVLSLKYAEAVCHNNIGVIFERQRNYDGAKAHYLKATEIEPAVPLYLCNLGFLSRTQRRYDDAQRLFRKALEADPKHASAYCGLGLVYLDMKLFAEAEANLRKSLEADHNYAEAYNSLGLMFKSLKRYEEAETQFHKAMETSPREPLYRRNLGDMFRDLKRHEDAERWYAQALEVDANYAEAYNSRGLLLKDLKRHNDAEAQFRKALEIDPRQPLYPRNLGDMYRELKRYEDAERWYGKALEVDAGYADAHNDLGLMYYDLKRYNDAEAQFRKALEIDPRQPLYPRNLGDMYRELKRYEDAERWYGKALEVDAGYAAAFNGLGQMYKDLKRYEDAEREFRKAMELDPDGKWYSYNLADVYRELKRYEDAERWYGKALELDAGYAAAHNGLGVMFHELKRYDEAEKRFHKATEADPRQPLYPRNLGDVYRDLKRYEDAERWYGKALEVDAGYAAAYNDLGLMYEDLKRYDEAEKQFHKAIEAHPRQPLYPRNLGDMYRELKRYEDAERWYGKALEVDAGYAAAFNGLGLVCKDLERHEDAEKQFHKAMEADPRQPLYPRNLGDMYRNLKRYEDAERWYVKALEVDAGYAAAYNGLGQMYKDLKRYEDAEKQFRKAMEFDPDGKWYSYNLADMYRELKQYENAEHWYCKTLEMDGGYAYAYNGLGLVFNDLKRPEDAEKQFRKAMEADPREPIYPCNLGDVFLDLKRYEDAERWYGKALEADAGYAAAYNGLGLVYKDLKRYEDAEKQFRKAMEVDPDGKWYANNLGDMYRDLNRSEDAERWYRKALEISPDDADALNSFAWFLYQSGRELDEAEEKAKRAVELVPDVYRLHTLAAIRLKRHGWDEARGSVLSWLRAANAEFVEANTPDIVEILNVIRALGKSSELAAMLRQAEVDAHWLPWAAALESLVNQEPKELLGDEVIELRKKLTDK